MSYPRLPGRLDHKVLNKLTNIIGPHTGPKQRLPRAPPLRLAPGDTTTGRLLGTLQSLRSTTSGETTLARPAGMQDSSEEVCPRSFSLRFALLCQTCEYLMAKQHGFLFRNIESLLFGDTLCTRPVAHSLLQHEHMEGYLLTLAHYPTRTHVYHTIRCGPR